MAAEEIRVIHATAYRIAALAHAVPASLRAQSNGWSRVDADMAALSVTTRAASFLLRVDDVGTLSLLVHGPDGGATGPLDAASTEAELAQAVGIFGLPDGAGVLRQALAPAASARYDTAARLADVCRALGAPLELLTVDPTDPQREPEKPAQPEAGVVLVYAPVAVAAAAGPLALQSAWTVPLGTQWSMHVWDGDGQPTAPVHAAEALGDAGRVTLAYWWSARTAGVLLTRDGRVAGAHEWGSAVVATPESTARLGRALAEEFRLPEQVLAVITLLRRTDLAPSDTLAALCMLLRLPAEIVGLTAEELARWAASVPGAVHTEKLPVMAAVVHSVREAPPDTVLDELSARRPGWYRLANGVVAAVMAAATALLALLWRQEVASGWWVLLGVATTVSYAWGLRPGLPNRRPARHSPP
ncbi:MULTISPECIES: hypothetical protein [Micromonospora]|uniref:Uncharacterized protein n=1 Tax=Micromonospora solifontis TaxID=2487138 RepID=A0ABX9WBE3_9ACTN|nr:MULTISPECIES: hypothetical protein [Micromonospora]NES14753.1 hypothetical protein [Micromonospora sp. PPF5-17B]NES39293.1 hypothetical protein [Micromonospora solifontis]NES56201.1 hypothetical protein [Micromonospora sp. PPF5-6]RNL89615.1 hypothetical protein EFE23_24700 [Micromonospora solifontis]